MSHMTQAAIPPGDNGEVVLSGRFRRLWYNFSKRGIAVLGLVIVALFLLIALLAPVLAPYDPVKQDLTNLLKPPSAEHLLGTDEVGRDILSRLIYGSRISMRVGFVAVFVAFLIGVPIGITAGFFGRRIDSLLMRAMDVLMAFPGILLAILFVSIMGPSLDNAILSVGIYTVPNFARLARSETLVIKNNEYVEAATALGAGKLRIILTHILNNITAPLIITSTLSFGNAILTTSGMGFLGIGAQPPTPEWGAMLSSGRQYLLVAPHVTTIPGLVILLLVLGLNLFGDGLRDVLDPRQKS
jgi:peptide/nickel transport system permease protein